MSKLQSMQQSDTSTGEVDKTPMIFLYLIAKRRMATECRTEKIRIFIYKSFKNYYGYQPAVSHPK
jgi:hypothetical protein